MVYDDYLQFNINFSKFMGEAAVRAMKIYRAAVRGYLECCGTVVSTMLETMEDKGEKMTDNIEFFNGFMTGYEKCKKDMEEQKPSVPMTINRFISFYN